MKLLRVFESLGLNLDTGTSDAIRVQDVERESGKRLTGNGSIVRRDVMPWEAFNLENIRNKQKVWGYKFHGYKTVREVIGELKDQNESSKKRIDKELAKIDERNEIIKQLTNRGNLNTKYYTRKDIEKYL